MDVDTDMGMDMGMETDRNIDMDVDTDIAMDMDTNTDMDCRSWTRTGIAGHRWQDMHTDMHTDMNSDNKHGFQDMKWIWKIKVQGRDTATATDRYVRYVC